MRQTIVFAVVVLGGLSSVWAGGFGLEVRSPEASAEARAIKAVLAVQAVGCHNPAAANVSATAIGMIQGERRTIPLKLTPLPEPGWFAVAQQWPSEGRWVISFIGKIEGLTTGTLVAAGPEGVDRGHRQMVMHEPTAAEVDSMLAAR